MFWKAAYSRCLAIGICDDAVFVGPAVESALVLDACRKRVKVGFRGRRSSLDDFEFITSLLCVTGAALSSVLVILAEFHGRRGALGCRFRGRHSARSPSLWHGCTF